MKVLFIYPDILDYALFKGTFYTGIASLSAVLKKQTSHNVALIHITKPIMQEELIAKIESKNPDLIAFSSTTNMFPYVRMWSEWIKRKLKEIKIICGGVHPTIVPEEVIQNPYIDGVCIGEGEETIVELCNRLDNSQNINQIENLFTKDNGKVYKNPIRPLIQDLDILPFPDRTIFDYPNLHSESEGRTTVMISRGCPYNCSYCCNGTLRKIYPSSYSGYVRFRSVPSVIKELKQIKNTYSFIKSFTFDDDILPLNKGWFREFSSYYKKEITLPYDCNLRPNLVTEETVWLLKESGCYRVRIGIESGNEWLRNNILKRSLSDAVLKRAVYLCRNAGLEVYSFNMLGLPFETTMMMLQTVKMNAILPVNRMQATIFYPYFKTPLYELCRDEKLIDYTKEIRDYTQDTMLKLSRLKRNQIVFLQRYFRLLVKLYRGIFKLPEGVSRFFTSTLDLLISSSLSAIIILPILSGMMSFILRNKTLGDLARKINRKFLGT